MLLAIDTATHTSSLALHDGRILIAEESWQSNGMSHAVDLAPAVRRLFERAQLSFNDLTALAVSVGPGSYTGLRIGVAFAKGIASARRLPLVGISTFDTLAAAHPQVTGALIAVVQAGRGRVIASVFQWRKGRWKNRSEPRLLTWPTLIENIDGPATLTGEIDAVGFDAVTAAQTAGTPLTIAPASYRLRRAGFLAEEAWAQLKTASGSTDAAQVVPIYVKTKDLP